MSAVKRAGWRLILGPPGTGKTTTLLDHLEREVASCGPDEVAFATFTRAARTEALERAARKLDVPEEDLAWFRTIHSIAYRLLGLKREEVFGDKALKVFAKQYGYTFSTQGSRPDEAMDVTMSTEDDQLLAGMSWGRSRMLDAETTVRRAPFVLEPPRYYRFLDRYDDFRREAGLLDFHDMLEHCLGSTQRPPVRIAFVDEAQDLSPLQAALVEQWFEPCDHVYVGGDDDQAIYAFQGGDPAWLLNLARSCERVDILRQSYRVPALVHAVAQRIIAGNTERVEKEYVSRPAMGSMDVVDRSEAAAEIAEAEGSVFVLARNWYLLKDFAELLHGRGVPFIVERHHHWSPLGRPTVVAAVRTAQRLGDNKTVSARSLRALLEFIPSGKKGGGLLPHGVKAKVDKLERSVDSLVITELRLEGVVEIIREHGPTAILRRDVSADLRDALNALLRRHGTIPVPRVVLTSMHASKGRQADTVVVLPEMARRTHDAFMDGREGEREAEHRVAYVAVTRTKHRLLLCIPTEPDRCYLYASYASKVLASPPTPPPPPPPPPISARAAEILLDEEERLGGAAERAVVREWYAIVSEPVLYPKLRQVAARFMEQRKSLAREGMEEGDSNWAAYLHCRDQSE